MSSPSEALNDDAHASALRLANLVHELTSDRPMVRQMIERCIRALILEDRRRSISARLEHLEVDDLATVAALVAQLEKHRRDDA